MHHVPKKTKLASKPRPGTRTRTKRSAEKRRPLPRFTDRVSLGQGVSVSPFCLGTVGNWRLIPAAFEMGINFFFITTDMHWPYYEASRKGVKALLASRPGIREEIAVAGVCYPTQPEFQVAPFAELVHAVPRLQWIDVFVAGGVYPRDLLSRVDVLRALVAEVGRGVVGASFHDRQAARSAANLRITDLCYVRYNPVHPGARDDLFPHVKRRHAPLFNFKSTTGFVPHDTLRALNVDPGLWYPDATDYYRYALSRPQMDGLLFAVDHQRHLEELHRALHRGGLTPAEEEHLEELALLATEAGSAAG